MQKKLGRYDVLEMIATGGMARVHRAKLIGAAGFEKNFAIKEILPYWSQDKEFVGMLIDEAKVLVHLTHANIVQVFELCHESNQYFIVMEYVRGVDLKTLSIGHKKLPLSLVFYIIKQILIALDYAHHKKNPQGHSLGIVHRDISPQNILISQDGNIKITDFGIAKIKGKTSQTQAGTLKGKFAYMSPEQAMGLQIDAQTDLFSTGILLFELIICERCFKGKTDLETLEAVKQVKIQIPQAMEKSLPTEVKNIITKALHRDKSQRYTTARSFLKDIQMLESLFSFEATSDTMRDFLQPIYPHLFLDQFAGSEATKVGSLPNRPRTKVLPAFDLKTKIMDKTVKVLQEITKAFSFGTLISNPFRYWSRMSLVLGVVFLLSQGIFRIGPATFQTHENMESTIVKPIDFSRPRPMQLEPSARRLTFRTAEVKDIPFRDPVVSAIAEEIPINDVEIKESSKISYGGLVVSARPWGRVFVSGISHGMETPFLKNNVPTGAYNVQVRFANGKSTQTTVRILENSLVKCAAILQGTANINCH